MPKPRVTKEKIATALVHTKGLVYLAAKEAGCSYQTVYNYLAKHPDLMEIADEQNGQMGDFAEGKLFAAIQSGEAWAIAFYLKTKQRKRGYVEKTETENSGTLHVTTATDLKNYTTQELQQLKAIHEAADVRRDKQGA